MITFYYEYEHEAEGVHQFDEPEGWIAATWGLERHPVGCGVVEYWKSPFRLYGTNGPENGGRDWAKLVQTNWGPNANITVRIYLSKNDGYSRRKVYEGDIPVHSFVEVLEVGHVLELVFSPQNFWSTFLFRFDKPVDIQSPLTLDGEVATIIANKLLKLTPQVLDMEYKQTLAEAFPQTTIWPADFNNPDFQTDIDSGKRANVELDTDEMNELPEVFNIAAVLVEGADDVPAALKFRAKFKGNYDFDLQYFYTFLSLHTGDIPGSGWFNGADAPVGSTTSIKIEIRDGNNIETIILNREDLEHVFVVPPILTPLTQAYSRYYWAGTRFLNKGAEVRIFLLNGGNRFGYANNTFTIVWYTPIALGLNNNEYDKQPALEAAYPGDFWFPASANPIPKSFLDGLDSHTRIVGHTLFDETTSPMFHAHDVVASVIERIVGPGRFKSDFLGGLQTTPAYGQNGCGYWYGLLKGWHLRGKTLEEKRFFESMQNLWDGLNPHLNLGFGYTNDGKIEIEEKRKFFNKDGGYSAKFFNVAKIRRVYDGECTTNEIVAGSTEGKIEDINGVDDFFQNIWLTLFKTTGKKLELLSTFITTGLTFEQARRLSVEKTTDYRYDDKTFMAAMVPDGGGYKTEVNENFADTTGLRNEETRINKRLSPARMVVRWLDYIAVCLQHYLDTPLQFSEGKGNYDMQTTMVNGDCNGSFGNQPLSEKQNIPVGVAFLYRHELYEVIEHPMTIEQMEAIIANRDLPIGIAQTNNEADLKPLFLKNLQFKIMEGDFTAQGWAAQDLLDIKQQKEAVLETPFNQEVY